jgi:hypothetical protein
MANWFVDTNLATGSNDGTSTDDAWQSIQTALQYSSFTPGDKIWIKRDSSFLASASDIALGDSGTAKEPLYAIGWPRAAETAATGATWTNGSTTVDLVTGLSMDREKHQARYVDAPDGEVYLITKVTDSNTFVIDREYVGPTVTLTDGAFDIQQDSFYTEAQAIDDSGWTIKLSTWTDDADDLPVIDFNDLGYDLYFYNDRHWHIAHLELRDSLDGSGVLRVSGATNLCIEGCLLYQDQNEPCMSGSGTAIYAQRTIFEGSGTGTGQIGISLSDGVFFKAKDVAIYNMGDIGIYGYGTPIKIEAEGLNVGVEAGNGDYDISVERSFIFEGRDVKLGAAVGEVQWDGVDSDVSRCKMSIENYGRVLGVHKTFAPQGTLTKKDVVAGSGDPYKRTGGADSVLEIAFDGTLAPSQETIDEFLAPIFVYTVEATTESKNYRFYVQAEGAVTAAQLWVEVEYVSSYDDTSEYVFSTQRSDEAISARAGASDWSQYIEVTGIQPAVASKVRLKVYCSYYHASNLIYICRKPDIA